MTARCFSFVLLGLLACGEDATTKRPAAPKHACTAGERKLDDGRCIAAGVQDDGCAAGEIAVEDGACRPAGIPADACAPGFAPAGDGCAVILPPAPCADGKMAIPGETACRDVAPCEAGTWGAIPVEPDTQHVDATYAGTDSDGTPAHPWTTIAAAIDAAAPGAIVAIASGSYPEGPIVISGKPVRLWGRCPSTVEIAGGPVGPAAIRIRTGAAGTEIHDLAVKSETEGVQIAGSKDVVLDRVWIHDTAEHGIEAIYPATSVAIRRSLVERATRLGLSVEAATVALEQSVVRGTLPVPADKTWGRGMNVSDDSSGHRAAISISSSVLTDNREDGAIVFGSDMTVEASAILANLGRESDGRFGRGLSVQRDDVTGQRSTLVLKGSVVAANHDVGVFVMASDATVDAAMIQDTQPTAANQTGGRGFDVQMDDDSGERASAIIRSSVIANNHWSGLFVGGSDATVEATVIRDTQPRASDGLFGWGIDLEGALGNAESTRVTVRSSVVSGCSDLGVAALGTELTLEGTLVQDTKPRASDGAYGRGVGVEMDPAGQQPASATIRASVVRGQHDVGVFVAAATATIEGLLVEDTAPRALDDLYGDGIAVFSTIDLPAPGSIVVTGSRVASSARAGLSSFGGHLELGTSSVECNAISLAGEPYEGSSFSFVDLGKNACGCGGAPVACKVLSSGLAPPSALGDAP